MIRPTYFARVPTGRELEKLLPPKENRFQIKQVLQAADIDGSFTSTV